MITIKRAYVPASRQDGLRILVDRLWPRGVSKDEAKIDRWEKDLAPSTGLRKWFKHDPAKWIEFQRRYSKELEAHQQLLDDLAGEAGKRKVTLVYGAKDEVHNEAVVLEQVLGSVAKES